MTQIGEISKHFFTWKIIQDKYAEPMWIAVIYVWAINLLTLLAFGWDKMNARRKRRRVPEKRLLWLAMLGGSPAALLGRWIFGHKTRKRGFSIWLYSIVGIQVGLGYLVISQGLIALLQ
ncbi:hypothetical protein RKLH11_11 [Rhodobacteraceae bacterium KLH11]|nr:hypothetical protein RKLH11_11 [Rhodobacteraceae bacterium KLH11]